MLIVLHSASAATVPVTGDLRFWVSADAITANDFKQVRLAGGNVYLRIGWIKAAIGFTRPRALPARNRNMCQMPSMGSPSSGLAAPNT
jgi:hypothetical protein